MQVFLKDFAKLKLFVLIFWKFRHTFFIIQWLLTHLKESILIQHSIETIQQLGSRQKAELCIRDACDIPEFLATPTFAISRKAWVYPSWFFIILITISSIKFTVKQRGHLSITYARLGGGRLKAKTYKFVWRVSENYCPCVHATYAPSYCFYDIEKFWCNLNSFQLLIRSSYTSTITAYSGFSSSL